MKTARWFGVIAAAALVVAPAAAQQPFIPKPGPEHAELKKLEGTWEATAKAEGHETKGTMVWKMDMNGLWRTGKFEGQFGADKFQGYGMDSYDPVKKKYVSVWIDSMSASPLILEGDYDKEKKMMTMAGTGPGMDGKPMKYRTESEMKGDDHMVFRLYMGDSKEPFTIEYRRKK